MTRNYRTFYVITVFYSLLFGQKMTIYQLKFVLITFDSHSVSERAGMVTLSVSDFNVRELVASLHGLIPRMSAF